MPMKCTNVKSLVSHEVMNPIFMNCENLELVIVVALFFEQKIGNTL